MHKSSEYGGTKVLAVVFESNHCPVSQLYESRIEKIYEDYRRKGVTLVAINPNNPKAVRLNELGYTDVTDSLPEMKLRAAFRGIAWPYLYDGETQALSMKFGAVATPHIFLFDQDRKLRYQGRIDDNQREELVKTHDARDALDAMLEGRPVAVAETRAFGCTTKWMSKSQDVTQEWERIKAEPVTVEMVGAEELKALRANADRQSDPREFLVDRLSHLHRPVPRPRDDLPHVSSPGVQPRDRFDGRAERGARRCWSSSRRSTPSSPNKQFATADRAGLQAAWGAKWNLRSPFTMVIAPGGEVLYQKEGKVDILEVRRHILAAMPDTRGYIGSKAYWVASLEAGRKGRK